LRGQHLLRLLAVAVETPDELASGRAHLNDRMSFHCLAAVRENEDAAEMLALMEGQDASPYRLSDAQAAEVERRLRDKSRNPLTLGEFDESLRRFIA